MSLLLLRSSPSSSTSSFTSLSPHLRPQSITHLTRTRARTHSRRHTFSSSPLSKYNDLITTLKIQPNPSQTTLITKLSDLHTSLLNPKPTHVLKSTILKNLPNSIAGKIGGRLRNNRGVYIWGGVGVGKSFVMDLFYSCFPRHDGSVKSKRMHFHEFMKNVHLDMHDYRYKTNSKDDLSDEDVMAVSKAGRQQLQEQPQSKSTSTASNLSTSNFAITSANTNTNKENILKAIASKISSESDLICLDEFQVTDIVDATLLSHLFSHLFAMGTVIVITSNRAPGGLYEGGLNRKDVFEPFIEILEAEMDVVNMLNPSSTLSSQENLMKNENSELNESDDGDYRAKTIPLLGKQQVYFYPNTELHNDKLMQIYNEKYHGDRDKKGETIPIAFNRTRFIPNSTTFISKGGVKVRAALFDFKDICGSSLLISPWSQVDYLSLSECYDTVFILNIPKFEEVRFNETRRFINLLDALYEGRNLVYMTAEGSVDDIFSGTGTQILEDDKYTVSVSGEGGSSGRSTTMIGQNIEWSATGRIGASLQEFQGKQEVRFMYKRGRSRIIEMQGREWREKSKGRLEVEEEGS